ncbi:MAG: helix-turn-helix transcriptional regulator [bacterium]
MTSKELQKWRKRNNCSQSQLASALGVITITVSRWERGTRAIPSFLHLALRCLELEGGEIKAKGKNKKKRKEVKR